MGARWELALSWEEMSAALLPSFLSREFIHLHFLADKLNILENTVYRDAQSKGIDECVTINCHYFTSLENFLSIILCSFL